MLSCLSLIFCLRFFVSSSSLFFLSSSIFFSSSSSFCLPIFSYLFLFVPHSFFTRLCSFLISKIFFLFSLIMSAISSFFPLRVFVFSSNLTILFLPTSSIRSNSNFSTSFFLFLVSERISEIISSSAFIPSILKISGLLSLGFIEERALSSFCFAKIEV